MRKLSVLSSFVLIVTILGACTGGGGSASIAPTISGVAASGAALANADITVKDSTGKVVTTTTDQNGNYSVSALGLKPPLVIMANGNSGGAAINLVTTLANVDAGQSLTANITPITNAISAIAAGKDPSNIDPTGSDASSIISNLNKAKTLLTNSLSPILNAANVPNADLISTNFTANHTGLDLALDNLSVSILPDGSVKIYSSGAVSTNDLQSDGTSTPPAASNLASGQVINATQASLSTELPTVSAPAALINVSDLLNIQQSFKACFAIPASQRVDGNNNVIASACAAIFPGSYKNNGYSGVQELKNSVFISSSSMDGAVFDPPNVIQALSPTLVKIRISWTMSDLSTSYLDTVVQKTNSTWSLYGNQRNYYMFINSAASIVNQLNPNDVAFINEYQTGLNIYINAVAGNASNIKSVQVTGPGLPGYQDPINQGSGVLYMHSTAPSCFFLTLSSTANPGYGTNRCMTFFKLAGQAMDPAQASLINNYFDASRGFFANNYNGNCSPNSNIPCGGAGMLTDTQISAINPLSAYLFKITLQDNSVEYYIERLRGSVMTMAQVSQLKPIQLSQQTQALLTYGQPNYFTGGSSLTVSWNAPTAGIIPALSINVTYIKSGQTVAVNPRMPICKAAPTVSSCNYVVNSLTGIPFAADQTAPQSPNSDENFIQFISRTPNDSQIYSTYSYNFY
jgi:hypothetical protein